MQYVIAITLLATLIYSASTEEIDPGSADFLAGTEKAGVVVSGTHRSDSESTNSNTDTDGAWDWIELINSDWLAPAEDVFADCLSDWDDGRSCFLPLDDTEDGEDTVEIPAVTITDVAHFAPNGPALTGEPSNIGVAGLPTNFVATASAHTVDGEIFTIPVTVRFTPAGFDFTYGDGDTTEATTGGQTWHALGQAQFTPTPTSHTYTERGTYTAHVTVRYTADVDFGIGWIPLTGEITATGPDQQIRIYEAHTALVAHTCDEDPTAPGC